MPALGPFRPCLHCGTTRWGRYCHECGQDNQRSRLRVRDSFEDAVDGVTSLSAPLLRTLVDLFRHPGQMPARYVRGRRAPYVSPIRLALVTCALWWIAIAVAIGQTAPEELEKLKPWNRILIEHGEVVNILLLPTLSIPFHLVYLDARRTFAETFCFTLYLGSLAFTWRAGIALLGGVLPNTLDTTLGLVDQVLFLGYLIAGLRGFYGGRIRGQWLRIPLALAGTVLISLIGMALFVALVLPFTD